MRWVSISLRVKNQRSCPLLCGLPPSDARLVLYLYSPHLWLDSHTHTLCSNYGDWFLCLSPLGFCIRCIFCLKCFAWFAHLFMSLFKCPWRLSVTLLKKIASITFWPLRLAQSSSEQWSWPGMLLVYFLSTTAPPSAVSLNLSRTRALICSLV